MKFVRIQKTNKHFKRYFVRIFSKSYSIVVNSFQKEYNFVMLFLYNIQIYL